MKGHGSIEAKFRTLSLRLNVAPDTDRGLNGNRREGELSAKKDFPRACCIPPWYCTSIVHRLIGILEE